MLGKPSIYESGGAQDHSADRNVYATFEYKALAPTSNVQGPKPNNYQLIITFKLLTGYSKLCIRYNSFIYNYLRC